MKGKQVKLSEVAEKVREKLEEKGWYQGVYEGPNGELCTMGAYYKVMRDVLYLSYDYDFDVKWWNEMRRITNSNHIPEWNDDPDRTYEDVILTLKHAQADFEEKGL